MRPETITTHQVAVCPPKHGKILAVKFNKYSNIVDLSKLLVLNIFRG